MRRRRHIPGPLAAPPASRPRRVLPGSLAVPPASRPRRVFPGSLAASPASRPRRVLLLLLLLLLLLTTTGCLSFHTGPLPDEPEDATFIEADDTRVRYIDVGNPEGPPVVLLHGFNATLNTWDPVVPELADDFRVLALDLRGFGWTERPEGQDYSPEGQAELVFDFLDDRGVHEASVVAHSWGSSVALAMALDEPDRVERLALYSAWVYADQLPTFFHWSRASGVGEALFAMFYRERPADKMATAFYDESVITQELVEEVEDALYRPGALAGALEAVRGQRFEEVEHRYSEVDVPTLLLWGREDKVTALSAGERLSTQLPNADLVVFPRCGHFPMIEAVHASNRRLVKFLSEELRDEVSGHSRFPAGGEVAEGAFLTEVDGGVNSATPPISFSASPLRALAQDTRAHLPPDGEEMP